MERCPACNLMLRVIRSFRQEGSDQLEIGCLNPNCPNCGKVLEERSYPNEQPNTAQPQAE